MEQRVRIADIAEELGLSTATVSNVIHGKTNKISDETVKRVEKLLEEKQYIPSMAGILLSRNNSRIIGVVVNPHEKYEGKVLEDAFISSAINTLLMELEKNDYLMMLKLTTDWNEIMRYASMWNMDGLVLIGFCESDYELLRDRMHIPFVVYDGYFEKNERIFNLTIDHFDGGYQVGTYLYENGHRKILCIADNEICMDFERIEGCKKAVESLSKPHESQVDFLQVPMKKEIRQQFLEEHLEEIMEHTAVFAVSDFYAAELIRFLTKHGVKVPEDISVVGFDNSFLCENTYPELTTVGQDMEMRAKEAVAALKQLKAGTCRETKRVLPVKLVIRDSVGRV